MGIFRVEILGKAEIDNELHRGLDFMDFQRVMKEVRINAKDFDEDKSIAFDRYEDSFEKSGPRSKIYFNPLRTKAAIVTCGGLCPGMNAVVRGLVRQLYQRYQVKNIVGVRYGYNGLSKQGEPFLELTPNNTEDIHHKGGTMLGTSRGAPEVGEMVDVLERNNINILFTVGGDGTMRGALKISEEIKKRNLKIGVIGIPKTIDNDIPYVNLSFGFETAVEKASEVVLAGHEEARGHNNGIGLVKLMGRNAGFIAAGTVMATGVVNLCLVPEVEISMTGKNAIIPYIKERLEQKKHMMIVIAEGVSLEGLTTDESKRDKSGNLILPDVGQYLKMEITKHLKEEGVPFDLKYIDPSYYIRSAGPNSFDKVFCSRLAHNAVHSAMAGKTNMLVGYWHGEMTNIPLTALEGVNKKINPQGTYWFNIMENTTQPVGRN